MARQPATQLRRLLPTFTTTPGGPTRPELWHHTSTDGLWTCERDETTGTPWVLTYTPTGQTNWFTTEAAARAWATSPTALAFLRATALDVITTGGAPGGVALGVRRPDGSRRVPENSARCAAQVALARTRIAVLDGVLIHTTPQARCDCGGWLTRLGGTWVHVNACTECLTPGADTLRAPCVDLAAHRWCDTPTPAPCGHCRRDDDTTARACDRGALTCCGCCHQDR